MCPRAFAKSAGIRCSGEHRRRSIGDIAHDVLSASLPQHMVRFLPLLEVGVAVRARSCPATTLIVPKIICFANARSCIPAASLRPFSYSWHSDHRPQRRFRAASRTPRSRRASRSLPGWRSRRTAVSSSARRPGRSASSRTARCSRRRSSTSTQVVQAGTLRSTRTSSAACSASRSTRASRHGRFVYVYYTVCKVPGIRRHVPALGEEPRRTRHRGSTATSRRSREPRRAARRHRLRRRQSQRRLDRLRSARRQALRLGRRRRRRAAPRRRTSASLNGKILRHQRRRHDPVRQSRSSGSPGARGEIWALGFRNPFRCRFASPTAASSAPTSAQNSWEEIDVVVAGAQLRLADDRRPVRSRRRTRSSSSPIYSYQPQQRAARAIIGGDFGVEDQLPRRLPAELLLRRLRRAA